ncbi:MAG: cation:proton antiporter subunit C [Gammaproteobacteria bacterium]|nr:cation:proton antiporter subunit C [Gammaproteobacteria bacterium]
MLFAIGVYGLLQRRHLLRKVLAINLMGIAIFLLLITLGGGTEGAPDPVPQAMVLTGIVIAVSATAFALALLRRLHAATGASELDDD